jgi:hypothetical protein
VKGERARKGGGEEDMATAEPPTIRRLDQATVNRIAAGEVVHFVRLASWLPACVRAARTGRGLAAWTATCRAGMVGQAPAWNACAAGEAPEVAFC